MRSWSPQDVKEFLLRNNIKSKHAQALYDCEVRGEFLYSANIPDFKDLELDIPMPELILIKKAKENYLKGTEKTSKEERQIPIRKFGEPVRDDLHYRLGAILPCENTNFSLEEPMREFKAFSLGKHANILGLFVHLLYI